jgi:hypothetical protein
MWKKIVDWFRGRKKKPPAPAPEPVASVVTAGGISVQTGFPDMTLTRGMVIRPQPQGLITDEVATEEALADHADILWYADLTDFAAVQNEFNMGSEYEGYQGDVYGPATGGSPESVGARFYFVTVPEMSGTVRGLRWTTKSLTPNTVHNGNGSTTMNWKKFLNQDTLTQWKTSGWAFNNGTGTGVGTTEETDLYGRFCIYLEDTYESGINEHGIKLPGMERWAENVGGTENPETTGYVAGPMWHKRLDLSGTNRFFANTYWHGRRPIPPGGTYHFLYPNGTTADGGQVLPNQNSFELTLNTWHTIEQHLKINTFTGSTPNADAEFEFWFNDQLCYSDKNFVASAVPPFASGTRNRNEITVFWAQWFHGGSSTPLTPMNFRYAGMCLSHRRIGKAKLV